MSPREATIERIKRRTQEIEDDLREAKWVTDTARLALARAYEDQARRQRAVMEADLARRPSQVLFLESLKATATLTERRAAMREAGDALALKVRAWALFCGAVAELDRHGPPEMEAHLL